MYWHDKWDFIQSIEHEYKFAGKYGAKGEKRRKKQKATPGQIRKQNQRNREKRIRRLIKANFDAGDLWTCLKYPKGTRKPVGEVKEDLRKFLGKMRKAYKAKGAAFKFIYRMEIGKWGGIHIHILINRVRGEPETDMLIQQCWQQGRASYENIYASGGYQALADYIVKQPDDDIAGQISMFDAKERKELIRYSSSRNLKRPEPERQEYKRRTMRKLVDRIRGGDVPETTPGYYIDRDSVHIGVNRFTGYSYLQYTEYRMEDSPPWKERSLWTG